MGIRRRLDRIEARGNDTMDAIKTLAENSDDLVDIARGILEEAADGLRIKALIGGKYQLLTFELDFNEEEDE